MVDASAVVDAAVVDVVVVDVGAGVADAVAVDVVDSFFLGDLFSGVKLFG